MKGKRVSLANRYKRFFLSERTSLVAAVMAVLVLPAIWFFGSRSGGLDLAGRYDLLMRLLLIVTLFWSLKKHKLFLMQAAVVGLLIIHAARKQEAIRISVNQVSILFLLALVIVQLIIAPVLSFDPDYVLYVWTLHLDELFIFILVACAELILMIDQREFAGA